MLIKSLAISVLAAAVTLGPPRITVRTTDLPDGAVALVEAEHHTDHGEARIYGTAYTIEAGQRVEREVALRKLDATRYQVNRTWGAMPVALVLGVEQGDHGEHGVAEALVRVDRSGKAIAVDLALTKPIVGRPMPRRVNDREIEGALQSLGYRIAD